MAGHEDKNLIKQKRITFVKWLISIVVLYLIARLIYIQGFKSKEYTSEAFKEMKKTIDIAPDRGDIFDRNEKKLAISVPSAVVRLYPSRVNKKEKKREDGSMKSDYDILLEELPELLGLPQETIKKALDSENPVKLVQYLDRDKAVELKKKRFIAIEVEDVRKRFYPNEHLASHLLGFIGTDGNGLWGLELYYDESLSGRPGKWTVFKDSTFKKMPFEKESINDPLNGLQMITTIDETIQGYAEDAAENALAEHNAKAVHVLVMDPNTGEVLAMASKPDYNPNAPFAARDEAQKQRWASMSDEDVVKEQYSMWENYLISGIYEPGSTFKLITAAAALEENTTSLSEHFHCAGTIDVRGETLKCADPTNPHGELDIKRALEVSCNTTFVKIGLHLGRDLFYKYIRGFGFGEPTGIDLSGEQDGIIPNSASDIGDVQLATISYGHGLAMTPIQMLNAVNALVNGGKLMQPRLVKELRDIDGERTKIFEPVVRRTVISKETSDTMKELMESVIVNGSGARAAVEGYRIGGKTGTPYKIIDGKYAPDCYLGAFVAAAPIDNPKFTLLFIVDEPGNGVYYGGATAAPSAQPLLKNILEYMEVSSNEAMISVENRTVEVPNVVGMKLEDAGKLLSSLGIKHSVDYFGVTHESVVVTQVPEAGTVINKKEVVDLILDSGRELTMPSLEGLTVEEATGIINNLGFDVEVTGEETVKSQIPEQGTVLSPGQKIKLEAGE